MEKQHGATEQRSVRFVGAKEWELVLWKEWWRVGGGAGLRITTRRWDWAPRAGDRIVVRRAGFFWLLLVESVPDIRSGELRNCSEVHARVMVKTEHEAEVLP